MKVSRRRVLLLFGFFCFACLSSANNVFAVSANAMILSQKTLNRSIDPVIVGGNLLGEIAGKPISNLRIYAFQCGSFEPIRYQIDEMTGDNGDWIFTQGEIINKELGNGILDPWDKLGFMASDTGDKVPEKAWALGYTKGVEIEAIDPVTGEKGWCYLLYFASNTPARSSLPDYIHFSNEKNSMETRYWRGKSLITDDGELTNNITSLFFTKEGGGNEKNFVDRLKIRPTIKLLFGSVTIRLNEEKIKTNTLAYQSGPVRLIRRLEQYAQLPGGIKALRAIADVNQFETIGNCPATFEAPFRMDKIVSSFIMRFGTDYNENAIGSRIYSSNNPRGILVDGNMDDGEKNFNPAFDNWRLITGDIGTFMNRTIPSPEVMKHVNITVGITDDITKKDPPEDHPGCIGYLWQDWDVGKAPKGTYMMFLEFYWIPNYKPGDHLKYLNYMDNPVRVRVGDKEVANQIILIAKPGKKYM